MRADPLHNLSAPHTLVAVLVVEGTYPFKQICVATVPSSLGVAARLYVITPSVGTVRSSQVAVKRTIINTLARILKLPSQMRADPLHDLPALHTLIAVLVVLERVYPFKQLCVATVP